jgi:hypothetical protein
VFVGVLVTVTPPVAGDNRRVVTRSGLTRNIGPFVTKRAFSAHAALFDALAEHGPVPCQTSVDAEAWWTATGAPDAVEACNRCPVIAECLAYAISNDEKWGVWGGVPFDPSLSRLLPA